MIKLNVETNPNSLTAWDSLGEAYVIRADKSLAIEDFNKSLAGTESKERQAVFNLLHADAIATFRLHVDGIAIS